MPSFKEKLLQRQKTVVNLSESPEKTSYIDPRYWKLTLDAKNPTNKAKIRFLDVLEEGVQPFVTLHHYFFKGPSGRIYAENSRSTLGPGNTDPVYEMYIADKNAGVPPVPERKRKTSYIANILVIDDPAHPENNGKVKLFKFGSEIMTKITEAQNPVMDDEDSIYVFDYMNGADLNIIASYETKKWTYAKSKFAKPGPIKLNGKVLDIDSPELEEIANSCYDLKAEVSEPKIKSYDELKRILDSVMSATVSTARNSSPKNEVDEADENDTSVTSPPWNKEEKEEQKSSAVSKWKRKMVELKESEDE